MTIAITGIGLNTALGSGYAEHAVAWQQPGIYLNPITHFDTTGARMRYAHCLSDLWRLPVPQKKIKKWVGPKDYLAIATAWQAWEDAQLSLASDPFRRAVFVGSCSTAIEDFHPYFEDVLQCVDLESRKFDSARFGSEALQHINPISAVKVLTNGALAHISQTLQAKGPNSNFIDCELSGFLALQAGVRALTEQRCDVAIVGAVATPLDPFQLSDDALQYDLLPGGSKDEITAAYLPGQRQSQGRSVAEGSCFFVLERAADAKARAAKVYGRITALTGSSLDMSLPWRRPEYRSLAECLRENQAPQLVLNFNGSPRFDAMVAASLAVNGREVECLAPLLHSGDLGEVALLYQICWSLQSGRPLSSRGEPYHPIYQLAEQSRPTTTVTCVTMSRFGCTGMAEVER